MNRKLSVSLDPCTKNCQKFGKKVNESAQFFIGNLDFIFDEKELLSIIMI